MSNVNQIVKQSDIIDNVLTKVNKYQELGELVLPDNYSAENALKSAYLILTDLKTRDGNPVLQSCTKASIANALLDMVVQGLSPMKSQCSFIAYGDKLQCQREYAGTIALAKRFGDVKHVHANVIYDGDEFKYEVNERGVKILTEHSQDFKNIDNNKLLGAYAVVTFNDGSTKLEIMSMLQIRAAWNMGAAKGNSKAHQNFPDQMSIKTVINRACKLSINSSDDGVLDLTHETQDVDHVVLESEAETPAVEELPVVEASAPIETKQEETGITANVEFEHQNGQAPEQEIMSEDDQNDAPF